MTTPTNLRLDEQLCFALYTATHAVQRAYRPLLGEIGLTYTQYLVMLALWQDGERSIGEIATRLSLPTHAVGPVVDRLRTAGLVRCVRNPRDRRSRLVALTDAGAALEEAASIAQRAVVCQTNLSDSELQELHRRLRELVEAMAGDEHPTAAGLEDFGQPTPAIQGAQHHDRSDIVV